MLKTAAPSLCARTGGRCGGRELDCMGGSKCASGLAWGCSTVTPESERLEAVEKLSTALLHSPPNHVSKFICQRCTEKMYGERTGTGMETWWEQTPTARVSLRLLGKHRACFTSAPDNPLHKKMETEFVRQGPGRVPRALLSCLAWSHCTASPVVPVTLFHTGTPNARD